MPVGRREDGALGALCLRAFIYYDIVEANRIDHAAGCPKMQPSLSLLRDINSNTLKGPFFLTLAAY